MPLWLRLSFAAWDIRNGGEPDPILLDGGAGHVGVVRRALSARGIDIPVFGMVKDEHHCTREIVDEEGVAGIARNQSVFQFVYRLQEEVHRFTVAGMSRTKRKNACQVIADSSRWHRSGKGKGLTCSLGHDDSPSGGKRG